jgi:hypothetical protein
VSGERTSVGLDVYAESVCWGGHRLDVGEMRQARLTPSHDHVRSWIAEMASVRVDVGGATGNTPTYGR